MLDIFQTVVLTITLLVSMFVAVRQLRAYVSIVPLEFSNVGPNLVPRARYAIKNRGLTPAYELRHNGALLIVLNPLEDDIVDPREKPVRMTLNTNGEVFGNVQGALLTADDIKNLMRSDEIRFSIFAVVEYRDTFRISRRTEVCAGISKDEFARLFNEKAAGNEGVGTTNFLFAARNNVAT